MIILLEGCDGAGKTTLAKRLAQDLHLTYMHEGPPPLEPSPLEYYSAKLGQDNVIWDRFALGERVYGPVFRGTDRFSVSDWEIFEGHISALFTPVHQILCVPPFTKCLESWRERQAHEMIQDEATLLRVYMRFLKIAPPSTIFYDWTTDDYDTLRDCLGG